MIPRSVRNCNPGNIRKSATTDWNGAIPGDDLAFVTFDTPASGFRALAKVILAYEEKHGLHTVREIINRYAPPAENDTDAYIWNVCKALDVLAGEDLPPLRFNADILTDLCLAIARHEAGGDYFTRDTAIQGVNRATQA